MVVNYKRCRLYVRINDGTYYIKKAPLYMKNENIAIIEKIRTEYLAIKSVEPD